MSLGLPDAALGVAWPYVRRTFAIPLEGLGVLLFAALETIFVLVVTCGVLVLAAYEASRPRHEAAGA